MLVPIGNGVVNTEEVKHARESQAGKIEVVFKDGSKVRLDSSDAQEDLRRLANLSKVT